VGAEEWRIEVNGWTLVLTVLAAAAASLCAFAESPSTQPTTRESKLRLVLVGDSTVTDKEGWGLGFKDLVGPDIDLINMAKGGRSSKSYLNEGHWTEVLKLKPDYVILQFGHNDCPGKGPERETDPDTTFYANMARYVDEARAIGAKPILLTSLTRRRFRDDGKIHSDLTAYADAVKRLATEKKVPLVDLHACSIEYFDQLGPDGWQKLASVGKDGKPDATHLNPDGSRAVAKLVAEQLRKVVPELAAHLEKEK
jgi:lysophospholipase L1-like esterase